MTRKEWEDICKTTTKEEQKEFLKYYFRSLEGLTVLIQAKTYNMLFDIGIRKGFSE